MAENDLLLIGHRRDLPALLIFSFNRLRRIDVPHIERS